MFRNLINGYYLSNLGAVKVLYQGMIVSTYLNTTF